MSAVYCLCPCFNNVRVKPIISDDCGRVAKALYPFHDSCFQKFLNHENPKSICSKTGILKKENVCYDRYTYADCGCDEESNGNGFFCYRPCSRSDEKLMGCKNELVCQISSNGTKFCGCTEGTVLRDSIYCKLVDDSCSSCRHNCHAASRCMSTNDINRFSCSPCDPALGYTGDGKICKDIDECTLGSHSCDKNAECINLVPLDDDFQKYKCVCRAGFRNDTEAGTSCRPCQDENECEKNPGICGNNAICQNTPGSYVCQCKPGFISKNGDCQDIDECKMKTKCHSKAVCKNTIGSYTCKCKMGFIGDGVNNCDPDPALCNSCDANTTTCVLAASKDKYECQCKKYHVRVCNKVCTPQTYCDDPSKINCAPKPKSICTDNPDGSGFQCSCSPGYIGNGTYCIEKDICDRERPCQYVARTICVSDPNDPNKYSCDCKPGFVRQLEGIGNNSAPCFEIGGYMANNCTLCNKKTEECMDIEHEKVIAGTLKTCVCKPGYRRAADGQCRNINECLEKLDDCDPYRAKCEDRDPYSHGQRFKCACLVGYEGSGKKDSCKNINECANKTHPICYRKGRTQCVDTLGSYKCNCDDGYRLDPVTDTCEDVDECSSYLHECKEFSDCVNDEGSYHCVCSKGFRKIGQDLVSQHPICENINQCIEGDLLFKKPVCDKMTEDCISLKGSYECTCKKGYELVGNRCLDIDECRDSLNNICDLISTTCNNLNGTYECVCLDGFEKPKGKVNSTICSDIDECATNRYTCHPHSVCRDTFGSYICQCEEGYHPLPGSNPNRPYCQRDKICEKQLGICVSGRCIDILEEPYYKCECAYGTAKYNETTCIDGKYCDNVEFNCPTHSKCSGAGRCECDSGFRWVNLKLPLTLSIIQNRRCKEIDWCLEVGTAQCKHTKCRATPQKGPGTGECYCDSGFDMIEGRCEDKNECIIPNICPSNSTCENKIGSYQCNCNSGFSAVVSNLATTLINPDCQDIDECYFGTDNCSEYKNTHCKNKVGSFVCPCNDGYIKNSKSRECVDDNECLREQPVCNTTTARCINYDGTYECQCLVGFRGKGTIEFPCIDINECAERSDNCTLRLGNSYCQNTYGSWDCICKEGYRMKNGECQNVNECTEKTHNCKHSLEKCFDLSPGYRCDCLTGYERKGKNSICSDIDECLLPGYCPSEYGNICLNKIGSFECQCADGFRKPKKCSSTPNSCSCENIDECKEGREDGSPYCGANAECHDTFGSATCTCIPKYEGDPYSKEGCKPSSVCDSNPCKQEKNSKCVEDPNIQIGYRCICNDGFIYSEIFKKCIADPCLKRKCDGGGPCYYYENFKTKKIEIDCNCLANTIYDSKKDKCVNSDVCGCGKESYPCRNAKVCSDPSRMFCSRNGFTSNCYCDPQFVYNNKTRRCDEKDFCFDMKCDPIAKCINIKSNSICNCNSGAFCECPRGMIHVDGKCIVDKDCSRAYYCRNDPNTVCEDGFCVCNEPYYRAKPTDRCQFEDPCARFRRVVGRSPCGPHSTEQAIMKPRECKCNCHTGFYKSGDACIDIDECQGNNPCSSNVTHPECINTEGSFYCACGQLNKKFEIFQGKCQIPDPCIKNQITCGPNAKCSSLTGNCECLPGFQFVSKEKGCENINECLSPHLYNCPENSECIDKIPNYECKCQKGYKRVVNKSNKYGYSCVDIDECDSTDASFVQCPADPTSCIFDENFKVCPDGSSCINIPGDYRCECHTPLLQFGHKDCAQNTTTGCGGKCGKNSHCLRIINENNVYNCTCDLGYELMDGSRDCKNIDECLLLPNVCPPNSMCIDLEGSYRCDCLEPYVKNGQKCVLDDKCKTNPCPQASTCKQLDEKQYGHWVTCICNNPGYRFNQSTFLCNDINECQECTEYGVCPCPRDAIKCINSQGSFSCECPKGYIYNKKTNKCDDVDECSVSQDYLRTCPNIVGSCKNTIGSWKCACNPGYRSISTQECIFDDVCADNRDTCNRTTTDCQTIYQSPFYKCECKEGYQPDPENRNQCVDKNECTMGIHSCNPMTEDCVNLVPGFICNCTTGYERIKNVCSPSAKCTLDCPEHSQCIKHRNGSVSCVCFNNYEWVESKKACSIIGCDKNNCPAHSRCVESQVTNTSLPDGHSLRYRCVCDKYYVKDEKTQLCLPPINPCNDVDCGNGNCIKQYEPPFYACSCPTANCQNVSCLADSCDKNAVCLQVANNTAIQCICKPGFTGSGLPNDCYKESPCAKYSNTCSNFAKCVDGEDPDEYQCVCDAAYVGNGTYCYDLDECATGKHNCNVNADCINTQGGYSCKCKSGYRGTGFKCSDIDECLETDHGCEITSTVCNNTMGSYFCSCKAGYINTTYPFYRCIDIDECALNSKLCGIHKCINTAPGYSCECSLGYERRGNSLFCEDIDECARGSHLCHRFANCYNNEGSYDCTCKEGYQGDGKTNCNIIDLCATGKHKCNLKTTTCQMLPDRPNYKCQCLPGYQYPIGQSDPHSCEDILECKNSSLYNPITTACEELLGSYRLYCKKGYTNTHSFPSDHNCTCTNLNECAMDPAYAETITKLYETYASTEEEIMKVMVPPKNNNSGYAFCYNQMIAGGYYNGMALLPLCFDASPEYRFPYSSFVSDEFPSPIGFGCTCANGNFTYDSDTDTLNCNSVKCNCDRSAGLICKQNMCVCEDSTKYLRLEGGIAKCVNYECEESYPFPPNLANVSHLIRCVNNCFQAVTGYKLVRHDVTNQVIDVEDIDECAQLKYNPCCTRPACEGAECVRCINTIGSYSCYVGNNICASVNKDTCECNAVTCPIQTSWFHSCDGYNASSLSELDQPQYKRKLCSRIKESDSSKLMTFENLRELYNFINNIPNEQKYMLACAFAPNFTDLSNHHMFNYWGPCTDKIEDVTCNKGTPFFNKQKTQIRCPLSADIIPITPAIGQPIGHPYPVEPLCYAYPDMYKSGNFFWTTTGKISFTI